MGSGAATFSVGANILAKPLAAAGSLALLISWSGCRHSGTYSYLYVSLGRRAVMVTCMGCSGSVAPRLLGRGVYTMNV